MTIFRKYFLKEFFRYFSIVLLAITSISVVAEFFDKVRDFYAHKAPALLIIQYLLLQTPRVILYALPFASLFSILITLGIASKWREIVVIKASGSSTRKLFSGFLLLGLLISLIALLLGETVVPEATRSATELRKYQLFNESRSILHKKEAIWLKGLDKSLIRINGFVESGNRILKTSIFTFTPSFGLAKRIEAEEGHWTEGAWVLKNVSIFDFSNKKTEYIDSLISTAIDEPKIFRDEMRKPKEMNFTELYQYYSRLEKAGFKNLKYMVRLYEKLAYPTINFIMILFGLALALNSKWGGGIKSAGMGVLITVSYWLIYSVSVSLGNTGFIPPWFAPWIGPMAFGIAGSVLYFRISE